MPRRRVSKTQVSDKPLLLDASALMALLRREAGWEEVQGALRASDCLIGAAQLVEVEGKLVSRGEFTALQVRREFALLNQVMGVVPFEVAAQGAASFYYARRTPYDLSLGDCLCLGTAERLGADVLTAERKWARVPDLPFEVRLIRKS